jgi:DMSO/TMAO reductase YedYZ molybdopterin-dependent catalytic subunit
MKRLLLIILLILLSGCTQTIELEGVEVREYQGEDLSSVNDFRENSIAGPQYVNISNYALRISGLVEEEKSLSYEEILSKQSYSKVVTLYCVEGWNVKILWEGVLVKDILDEAKIMPEANTVIFYAYDGYSTSLPLDYILENNILMAYKMNSVTLPPERGFPFQLVAEDKWGYKWIKWITGIELSDDPQYEGYWESRGYSNEGDLDKPYF